MAEINYLYDIRKKIIQLKTNAEDDFHAYFNEMDVMLDFDIDSVIDVIIGFMNNAIENFIEFKKTEYL